MIAKFLQMSTFSSFKNKYGEKISVKLNQMQATFSRAYWQQKQKHKTNTVANYCCLPLSTKVLDNTKKVIVMTALLWH